MLIWELLLIISVAGMVVILARRIPQAVETARAEHTSGTDMVAPSLETLPKSVDMQTEPAMTVTETKELGEDVPSVDGPAISEADAERSFKASQFEQAAEAFAGLVESDLTNQGWRNRLGMAYLELERFHEARDEFRMLVKAAPDSASHSAHLAMAEYGLGHYLTAIRHLKRAIALAPNTRKYQDLLETIEAERG